MTENDPKLIQPPVRVSSSKLWDIQQSYFATRGIEAWKDEVPFYISSNAFIGQRYALLVINYIKDWQRLNPKNDQPFYLMEIGSGTGTFSYYFLSAFKELLSLYQLNDLKFCYIVTDIIQSNLDFCRNNESFSSFIANGELDFAYFNVAEDKDFKLQILNKNFSELNPVNPFIVVANYTFDCIKQDIFSYQDNKFNEIKLGIRSRYKNFDVEKARYLSDLRLKFEESEVDIKNYYDNPILNEILEEYQGHFKEKPVKIIIPLGATQFFDHLKTLSNQKFLVIVGDKGISMLDRMPTANNQLASFDGCYSFTVNFQVIGSYLKKSGGDCLLTEKINDFNVNLYGMGAQFDDLTETKAFFETSLENVGPDEYSSIFAEYLTNGYRFSIRGLLAFLRLSEWDPDAYSVIHDRLMELLPTLNERMQAELDRDLEKVSKHIYKINLGQDIFNLLGIYYQRKKADDKALIMYELSNKIFPEKGASHNNMAIIYESQKNIPKALAHYQKAYELDKNNIFAKRKALILSGKPTYAYVMPILKGLFVVAMIAALIYFTSK